MRRGMDDQQNLSQLATVITSPETNRLAPIYRKKVALPRIVALSEGSLVSSIQVFQNRLTPQMIWTYRLQLQLILHLCPQQRSRP